MTPEPLETLIANMVAALDSALALLVLANTDPGDAAYQLMRRAAGEGRRWLEAKEVRPTP